MCLENTISVKKDLGSWKPGAEVWGGKL